MAAKQFRYDIFISYAREDAPWVEGYLLDAFKQAGVNYHTEETFALGVPRLLEFEKAIQESQRTLLILSPAYLAENFNQFFDLLAQSFGLESATWPVIPLILKPVDLPLRLSVLTALDATDPEGWEDAVARLCSTLQTPPPPIQPLPECPYPGMVPFAEKDQARFFGRDAEIQEVVERLRLHPFLTVIGPSGSGKSSLVFAGVLPALRKSTTFGPGNWVVQDMRPGETPLASLQEAFRATMNKASADRVLLIIDQFEETFTLAGSEAGNFQSSLLRLLETPNIFVILTVRADFYADLMASPLWPQIQQHRLEVTPLNEDGLRQAILHPAESVGVYIETALVERLMADASGEPGVLPLVQETLVLLWDEVERRFLPMQAYESLVLTRSAYGGAPRTGLQVAIARRADATLAKLSPEGQAIAQRIFLRLVQFGEGRADTRRQQTVPALQSASDPPEVFENTLQHLTANRLLTLSGGESDTSGSQRMVDISHEALIAGWPTLQAWLAERRDAEQTRRQLEGKAAEWIRLGRGAGGLLDEIEYHEAKRWLQSPAASDLGHSPDLMDFIRTSRGAIDAERRKKEAAQRRELHQAQALAEEQRQRAEEQTRSSRRFRNIAIGLVGVVILAVAAALFAFWSQQQLGIAQEGLDAARTETNLQQAAANAAGTEAFEQQSLANAAAANAEAAATEAAIQQSAADQAAREASVQQTKAAEAVSIAGTAQVNENAAIQEALNQKGTAEAARATAESERDLAKKAQAAAEAARLVALSRQMAAQGKDLAIIHNQRPASVDINLPLLLSLEAGRISQGLDPTYREEIKDSLLKSMNLFPEWNAFLPGELISLDAMEGRMWSLAISPDQKMLATGTFEDGRIWLWNALDGSQLREPLEGHATKAVSVVFSPEGQILASAGCADKECNQGEMRLWDVSNGGLLLDAIALPGNCKIHIQLAFSPDGTVIASRCSGDALVYLWGLTPNHRFGGQDFEPISSSGGSSTALAFSPVENVLAIGGETLIQLWDYSNPGNPVEVSKGLDFIETPFVLAFGQDGGSVAVGGGSKAGTDRDIRLWDLPSEEPHASPLVGHDASIISLAFSPDGTRLVSGDGDGFIRLWDSETGQLLSSDFSTGGYVYQVAFSPDGRTILAGSNNKTFYAWDVSRSREVSLGALMERACSLASRNLTRSEYALYVDPDPEAYDLFYSPNPTCPGLPVGGK